MNYCQSCILPDTRPHLVLIDGICNACRTHGTKRTIDWASRETAFRQVVHTAQSAGREYDCLIPVSGGKDSTWQVVKCLEHGLKPLAVTWKTPGRTEIGQKNLDNLVSLGVDHIDYQVNPDVERRLMYEAFLRHGSTAVPMHLAIFGIPTMMAVRLNIPLIVWGENSAFEYGGEEANTGAKLNRAWLRRHGVTHGTVAEDWVSDDLTARELAPYFWPSDEELTAAGIRAVFLGHYFEWDPEESFRVASAHGFRANPIARTGLYDYADIDDDFISVHHWLKWYKFGFTRTYDNLSLEIRNGRIAREEAVSLVRSRGDETPRGDIEKLCAFLKITVGQFYADCERFRNLDIWRFEGAWKIPGFLIPEWRWT